jgi:soluble lytic murein transglycosylase-like protein
MGTPARRPAAPAAEGCGSVLRRVAGILLLATLYGCGAGGFVPNGPHAIDAAALGRIVATESARSHVSPGLVRAIITVESHGDPSAISRAGAQGLMQLMPQTSSSYGSANPFDPGSNVAAGCRYLRALLARYGNNVALAVAAYNAGPGAVDASRGVPPFPETRAYVSRVTAALRSLTN